MLRLGGGNVAARSASRAGAPVPMVRSTDAAPGSSATRLASASRWGKDKGWADGEQPGAG